MPETLKEVLRKQVKIISYNSLNYDVSPEQNIIEKTNKDAQNKLTDSNIQDAIKYIKTLSTTGQLNDNTLYSYTRHCRSKTKIFLERFIKLYKYVDLDSLLHQLWESRTSNSVVFQIFISSISFSHYRSVYERLIAHIPLKKKSDSHIIIFCIPLSSCTKW